MFGSHNAYGGYSSNNSYGNPSNTYFAPPPPSVNNNTSNETSWSSSLKSSANGNHNNNNRNLNYRQSDNSLHSDSLYGYADDNASGNAAGDSGVGQLELGVSGLNLDNGQQQQQQQRSVTSYANQASSRKPTSWASVASQPVKLQPKSLKSKMGAGLLGGGGGSKHLPPTVSMEAWESKNGKSIPPPAVMPSSSTPPQPPVIEPQDIAPLVIDDPALPPPGGYQHNRGTPPSNVPAKTGTAWMRESNGRSSSPHSSPRSSQVGGNGPSYQNRGRRDSVEEYSSNDGSVGGRYGDRGGYNYRNNQQPPPNYSSHNNYHPPAPPMPGPNSSERDYVLREMPRDRDYGRDEPRDRDAGFRDFGPPPPLGRDRDGGGGRDYGQSRGRYPNDYRDMNYQQQAPTPPAPATQSSSHRDYTNNARQASSASPSPPITQMDAAALEKLQEAMKNVNPKEMELDLTGARFFIIKSYSEDDIHRSIKYAIWCSTEHGNKRLDQAYRQQLEAKAPIFLFFSVNRSGHFCGVAQMTSAVDYNASSGVWSQDKWRGQFQVEWLYVKDVPNDELRHITLENNENKPVTHSRDTQEVPYDKGRKVLMIIHSYLHRTSLFDDFLHYEAKQEEELMYTRPPAGNSPMLMSGDSRGGGGGGGGYNRNMPPPYRGGNNDAAAAGPPILSVDSRGSYPPPPPPQYNRPNQAGRPGGGPGNGGPGGGPQYRGGGYERGGDYRDYRNNTGGDGGYGPRRNDYRAGGGGGGDFDYGSGGRGDYHRDRDFHPPPPQYRSGGGGGGGGARDYREPPPQPRSERQWRRE